MQDYQNLNRHLEAVEGSVPIVGLVEETEERLMDRITLYQVLCDRITRITICILVCLNSVKPYRIRLLKAAHYLYYSVNFYKGSKGEAFRASAQVVPSP